MEAVNISSSSAKKCSISFWVINSGICLIDGCADSTTPRKKAVDNYVLRCNDTQGKHYADVLKRNSSELRSPSGPEDSFARLPRQKHIGPTRRKKSTPCSPQPGVRARHSSIHCTMSLEIGFARSLSPRLIRRKKCSIGLSGAGRSDSSE